MNVAPDPLEPPVETPDESLVDEVATLFDDGRTYAEAEIAFQKTRAKLAGRSAGAALAYIALGLILLNIALMALAVGLVIALEPYVTIWGAIGIVVGALILLVGWLLYLALGRAKLLSSLFSSSDEGSGA